MKFPEPPRFGFKMGQEVWISGSFEKSCGLFKLVQKGSPHPVIERLLQIYAQIRLN